MRLKKLIPLGLTVFLGFLYCSLAETCYGSESELDSEVQANVKKLLETRQCLRCNLQGADLRSKNLRGVNLHGSDLRKVDLSNAYLDGADLSETNLAGASLSGMTLIDVDLRGANLSNISIVPLTLGSAKINRATKVSYKLRLVWEIFNYGAEGKNLRGVDLTEAWLNLANLRGANLEGADLRNTRLRGVDLSNANIRYANVDLTSIPLHLPNIFDLHTALQCNTTLPNGKVSMRDCERLACPVGFWKDNFNIERRSYSCNTSK
jgi:uncharacterized protein YjbI with pentapeptide repeats